jgi:leader peptidase (prepilin peptidase)/N-methyltransferase
VLATNDLITMLLEHAAWIAFVFILGACVGSFINVVNWRMPLGLSLSHPPSRCPTCGGRLRFLRENTPVLGWIMLRGKCKWCRTRISLVYPLIESLMGLVFVGLYCVYFIAGPEQSWWWEVGGTWWARQSFMLAWPAFVAIAFLIAGLYSITVIDARTFMIPLAIPVFLACSGMVLWLVQGLISAPAGPGGLSWPIPAVGWSGALAGLGGVLGAGVSMVLLLTGVLKQSFADYGDYVKEGDVLGEYPHARREMFVELLFLLPLILGIVAGAVIGGAMTEPPPVWAQALGASMLGWVVGGGIVWAVRILGTLGFGREAMGLGDVHLMAAVGAVLGWFLPLAAFFVAPFIGLSWTLAAAVVSRCGRGVRRELPYGPHLAVATVLVLLGWPAVESGWEALMPTVSMPERRLVEDVDKGTRLDKHAARRSNGPQ